MSWNVWSRSTSDPSRLAKGKSWWFNWIWPKILKKIYWFFLNWWLGQTEFNFAGTISDLMNEYWFMQIFSVLVHHFSFSGDAFSNSTTRGWNMICFKLLALSHSRVGEQKPWERWLTGNKQILGTSPLFAPFDPTVDFFSDKQTSRPFEDWKQKSSHHRE